VTPHPVTGVDVRDMVMAHREFRLAPAAVGRTAPGDRRHARRVAAHVRTLTRALHHHDGEDRLTCASRSRTSSQVTTRWLHG
jgi:hypothetical protein